MNRRAVLAWRRLSAALTDKRITRADLANALGVNETGIDARIKLMRIALPGRLPGGPHDVSEIRRVLIEAAPGEIEQMTAQCEAVRLHVFDLLGSGPIHLGERIDWHCDFKSGYRWDPRSHYSCIRFGDRPGVDVKVPWELSRGHHLPLLAQVAVLTGRDEFAQEAAAQMVDWIDTNPPEFGVNWVCAMDVGIRAVNWLWTAALISRIESVDDSFFEQLFGSLLAHGRHVYENLEIMPGGLRTNHYIADLVGLLYLGLCLPEIGEARKWSSFARMELASELETQVLNDGVSFESSIPYHRLVAEMFLSAALLARHHGVAFDDRFDGRLARMIDFTAAYTKPNGLAPQIGDADDGRLHVLTGYGVVDPRDHRHLLAAGAVLFARPDWYALAGDRWTEALWLGGAHTCRRLASPGVGPISTAFKEAGIYILRANEDVVVFLAGGVGSGGLGNHKHNDVLAIEVHLAGEDILIDPGTYLYTSDPAARNAFRSTRAHNTVVVDGQEQNRLSASLFSICADAVPHHLSWCPATSGGSVAAEHTGYHRLDPPITHRRSVSLSASRRVEVEDTFTANMPLTRSHRMEWTFAFAPGCGVASQPGGWAVTTPRGHRVWLTWPYDESGHPITIRDELGKALVSPRFGIAEPAPVLRWAWEGRLPLFVRFDLQGGEHAASAYLEGRQA